MLSAAEFDFIRVLVLDNTGIVIEEDKKYLVETRLLPLLQAEGIRSFFDLVHRLRSEGEGVLRRKTTEAMTNGETLFFRDVAAFDMLKTTVFPALIENARHRRRLTIWSAACSTGQEPYSIAMLLLEHFPHTFDWDLDIIATDYSSEHLRRARAGRYSQYEINRGLPATFLVKHFTQDGNDWVVSSRIRERVQFAPINLITDAPPRMDVDLLLLRNVMIYWQPETKRRVFRGAATCLAPGGMIVLGSAESTLQIDDHMERVAVGTASYYRLPQSGR